MYGLGIVKGLWVTMKHFVATYTDDVRWISKRYIDEEKLSYRQSPKGKGLFTIQYPEESLASAERFRYLPFLLYEVKPDGTHDDRCTSCGICAKVCPPQCIWIERTEDPTDRRVRQVRLTAKGRGLVARGVEARIAWVRDLATRVPPGELGGIIQALARLTDAANASDDEHLAKLAMVRSNG